MCCFKLYRLPISWLILPIILFTLKPIGKMFKQMSKWNQENEGEMHCNYVNGNVRICRDKSTIELKWTSNCAVIFPYHKKYLLLNPSSRWKFAEARTIRTPYRKPSDQKVSFLVVAFFEITSGIWFFSFQFIFSPYAIYVFHSVYWILFIDYFSHSLIKLRAASKQ